MVGEREARGRLVHRYAARAEGHNLRVQTPADRMRKGKTILASSGLSWEDLVVAGDELTLAEACELAH